MFFYKTVDQWNHIIISDRNASIILYIFVPDFSILINNGRIRRDNLKRMGRDERWLQKQVQQRGAQCIADVYLLMMNDAGQVYFAAKELG